MHSACTGSGTSTRRRTATRTHTHTHHERGAGPIGCECVFWRATQRQHSIPALHCLARQDLTARDSPHPRCSTPHGQAQGPSQEADNQGHRRCACVALLARLRLTSTRRVQPRPHRRHCSTTSGPCLRAQCRPYTHNSPSHTPSKHSTRPSSSCVRKNTRCVRSPVPLFELLCFECAVYSTAYVCCWEDVVIRVVHTLFHSRLMTCARAGPAVLALDWLHRRPSVQSWRGAGTITHITSCSLPGTAARNVDHTLPAHCMFDWSARHMNAVSFISSILGLILVDASLLE
jgi:hypothetical protein